jgi:hypothetical protein
VSAAFADWQPKYAEQGIATFPVENKRPSIKGWQHVRLGGSSQLALKFPDADAFGFQCGPCSRITLLDIDSNDANRVEDAVQIFGRSPVLWRTGSGNHAMPFRYNGEGRRIRPIPDLPVDVLGAGFAVAPPSAGAEARYRFLEGRLSQFSRLPALRLPTDLTAANENGVQKGTRNQWLFRQLLREVRYCDDFNALLDVGRTMNMGCTPQLSDAEVVSITKSVWGYEIAGNNWVGRKARASTDREELLSLSQFPPAINLLMLLRVSHPKPGDCFAIDQTKTAELLRWERNTIRTAIRFLLKEGHLERIYWGGKGKGDPHLYQLRRPDRG